MENKYCSNKNIYQWDGNDPWDYNLISNQMLEKHVDNDEWKKLLDEVRNFYNRINTQVVFYSDNQYNTKVIDWLNTINKRIERVTKGIIPNIAWSINIVYNPWSRRETLLCVDDYYFDNVNSRGNIKWQTIDECISDCDLQVKKLKRDVSVWLNAFDFGFDKCLVTENVTMLA